LDLYWVARSARTKIITTVGEEVDIRRVTVVATANTIPRLHQDHLTTTTITAMAIEAVVTLTKVSCMEMILPLYK
jgi:translation elongation factor EF-Ts